MAKNKIGKDTVLQLIKEEAYIITRKQEIYKEIQKIEEELKNLNECMGLAGQGLAGTFGFKNPADGGNKTNTGFVNPMSISHIEQLAKDMGMENPYNDMPKKSNLGFGDEYSTSNKEEGSLKQENELLKKELGELKAMLSNNKQ